MSEQQMAKSNSPCSSQIMLDISTTPLGTIGSANEQITDSNIWDFTYDYGSLPVILFACLPTGTQSLICQRIRKSSFPLFVLVTSSQGHWCLLQLIDTDYSPNCLPSMSSKEVTKTHVNREERDVVSELPTVEHCDSSFNDPAHRPSLRLNFGPHLTAMFTGSQVVFRFRPSETEGPWFCPFCSASFSFNIWSVSRTIIKQHLRLHIELRCCMDCSTVLPNDIGDGGSTLQCEHNCAQLMGQPKRSHLGVANQERPKPIQPDSLLTLKLIPNDGSRRRLVLRSGSLERTSSPKTKRLKRDRSSPVCAQVDVKENDSATANAASPVQKRIIVSSICRECNLAFESLAQYQQHRKNVHRGHRYYCSDCGTSFSTKGNLTVHFQVVHNQSGAVQCRLCDRRFSNKFNADRHLRSVHENQLDDLIRPENRLMSNESSESLICPTPPNRDGPAQSDALCDPRVVCPHYQANCNCESKQSRGFYLYLSNQTGSASSAPSPPLKTDTSSYSALVADVRLVPCSPDNPDAQYGRSSSAWCQNVLLPKNFLPNTQ